MKNTLNYIIIVFAIASIALFGCETAEKKLNENFDLNQLVGRWEHVENKNNQLEEWQLISDDELRGKGFVLENGDTTFIESLSIKRINNILVYTAEVGDQNHGEKIPFNLTAQTAKTLEFSNYSHDFPQRIVYEMKSDTTLQAYIEGPRDGQKIRIVFDYIKR